MSDHKGAALIFPMLPDAETIIADKGYDNDAFRDALARTRHHGLHSTASQAPAARNILQDFVSTAPQAREYVRKAKRLAAYLNALDRCVHTFFSAICIAATVIFWLGQ